MARRYWERGGDAGCAKLERWRWPWYTRKLLRETKNLLLCELSYSRMIVANFLGDLYVVYEKFVVNIYSVFVWLLFFICKNLQK